MIVALGQIDPTIGDFDGNRRLITAAHAEAARRGADLLLVPELALSGYPPKDLLERPAFLATARAALEALARATAATGGANAGGRAVKPAPGLLVGFPEQLRDSATGRRVANAAALIEDGRITAVVRKSLLPTYDVFDEWRYFEPATEVAPIDFRGRRLGVSICEDIWNDADFWPHRLYRTDPIETLVARGAEILINLSASPFTMEKRALRPRMLAATARRWKRPLLFVNQVGGQDDLVFDGASLVLDADGTVLARGHEHAPDLIVADLDGKQGDLRPSLPSDLGSAIEALTLGTRDYARRCGFRRALLGLSGGIDSALVACVAARALGAENVLGVAMPSRFSSEGSLTDAASLAQNLGIDFNVISIEPMFEAYLGALAPAFADARAGQMGEGDGDAGAAAADLAMQNLQARIRGAILMALSNRHGRLLLSTGNKSELATGYCTLYGDMAGGLAVISDVPKTLVYQLAREINRSAERAVIPESTLTKPPSAELRPNQTDQDSLPPYDLLDAILDAHLEQGMDADALVAAGFEAATVADVVRRVRLSEYKRRQMPPGLKITGKAFGPGRRMPIAQAWTG
ncbi:MAG TPA: NAD+ synthase [Polyangia bacterium]|nr:NAD+ synthase [Polyangia bacterium]